MLKVKKLIDQTPFPSAIIHLVLETECSRSTIDKLSDCNSCCSKKVVYFFVSFFSWRACQSYRLKSWMLKTYGVPNAAFNKQLCEEFLAKCSRSPLFAYWHCAAEAVALIMFCFVNTKCAAANISIKRSSYLHCFPALRLMKDLLVNTQLSSANVSLRVILLLAPW